MELDAQGEDSKELRKHAVKFRRPAFQVLADAYSRPRAMITALLTILRSEPPSDREETIIGRALKYLDETYEGIPVLADLLAVMQAVPDEIHQAGPLGRSDLTRYEEVVMHRRLRAVLAYRRHGDVHVIVAVNRSPPTLTIRTPGGTRVGLRPAP